MSGRVPLIPPTGDKSRSRDGRLRGHDEPQAGRSVRLEDVDEGLRALEPRARGDERDFNGANFSFAKAAEEREVADLNKKTAQQKLDEKTRTLREAQKHLDGMLADQDKAERKVEALAHNFRNDWLRNRPLADFLDPTIKVKQTVIEH